MAPTDRSPLLILDLDETLVWGTKREPARHDFRSGPYYVKKRPHLEGFVARVFDWFEIAVWTSSTRSYATPVVEAVFNEPERLQFVWTSTRCTPRLDPDARLYYWVKDLKKVKRQGFALERTLMIDDSPEKLERQYGNHLPIHPFEGDPDDRELLDVLPFLDWIRTQPNFRRIEKRNWRSHESARG